MLLEIGKTYKNNQGRLIEIQSGLPPLNGVRNGLHGLYYGDSVDNVEPTIKMERYTFEGKWWSYTSQFSFFGYNELSNPELDLTELKQ